MTAHLRIVQNDDPYRQQRGNLERVYAGVQIVDLRGRAALNDNFYSWTFARRQRRRLFWRAVGNLAAAIMLSLLIAGLAWSAMALID